MIRSWLLALVALLFAAAAAAADQAIVSTPSFTPGVRDLDGHPMGGTEIRILLAHGGSLFAGNGYWKDVPGPGGTPGAQILRLDGAEGRWRVDHEFGERLPGGPPRHIAVSALAEATFRTDADGHPLDAAHAMLLASTWDATGDRTIFVRDDRTARWVGVLVAHDPPRPGFLPQIRSFGSHRDGGTGADMVFAGDTAGVFAGVYDPDVPGAIRWSPAPELAVTDGMARGFPGLDGRVRISSFAEADGRLFAAVGQQIWVRVDGPAPHWTLFSVNPEPFYSQTGLRGLTSVKDALGRDVLLAAAEGLRSRIVRIDAQTGVETTDLDVAGLLDDLWTTHVSYVIAAYNDMAKVARPEGGDGLMIGLEAFIPTTEPMPPGHRLLDVNHGLEGGAWFLLRGPDGAYTLHQVLNASGRVGRDLVAVRTAAASPFPGRAGEFYLGGYDANDAPAHDTGWIALSRLGNGHR